MLGNRGLDIAGDPHKNIEPLFLLHVESRELIRELMIDVSMMCFIVPHHQDHVSQAGIWRQFPVINCDLRCSDVFANALINISEVLGVAVYGFFLEVADDTVRGSRRAKIDQEEKIVENALRHQDEKAFECRRFRNVNERHQVHALVFRLIKKCADPAAIALHPA